EADLEVAPGHEVVGLLLLPDHLLERRGAAPAILRGPRDGGEARQGLAPLEVLGAGERLGLVGKTRLPRLEGAVPSVRVGREPGARLAAERRFGGSVAEIHVGAPRAVRPLRRAR